MTAVTVGLVACGKSKLAEPARARDLYTGQLFKAAAAYAEATYDHWYVVSAQHYLLHPDDVIDPYDMAMSDRDTASTEQWAIHVATCLRVGRLPQTGGRSNSEDSGPYLGQWLKAGGSVDLFMHAGRDYTAPLTPWVEHWATVHAPLAGLQIGQQLHWYAERRPAAAR